VKSIISKVLYVSLGGAVMITLREFSIKDAGELANLYVKNRVNLKLFEPVRPDEFYTRQYQKKLIEKHRYSDTNFMFGIYYEKSLAGMIVLSNIVRGSFQSAYMGYWLDEGMRNKG
jgi:ribosomal-protein-alanine N-acetyltransferase